ncbi:hypothetical protein K438DRAFT_516270 [Mycena galopus ATCC 62051]|nr:hypothetical protein K438DRAFT_516270 [Mycena galopus ATCC 62051]
MERGGAIYANTLEILGPRWQLCARAGWRVCDLYSEWLSRAGSSPLSLSLRASTSQDSFNTLIDLVRGVSQRWRDIELKLGGLPQTLSFPPGDYPLLERISIVPPQGGFLVSFHDAPKLREVFLQVYTAHIRLPRTQLTSFETHRIDFPPFLGLLREASNLVEGSFFIRDCDSSALPRTVLSLPHLQSLALGVMTGQSWSWSTVPMQVLNCLRTPVLTSLALSFPPRTSRVITPNDVSPFLSFVSRSCFQLHTLALSSIPATTESLILCLRAIPSLVHFKLKPLDTDIGRFFILLGPRGHILPQLESLHLVFPFAEIPNGVGRTTAFAQLT